jgi:hypothetical protein
MCAQSLSLRPLRFLLERPSLALNPMFQPVAIKPLKLARHSLGQLSLQAQSNLLCTDWGHILGLFPLKRALLVSGRRHWGLYLSNGWSYSLNPVGNFKVIYLRNKVSVDVFKSLHLLLVSVLAGFLLDVSRHLTLLAK